MISTKHETVKKTIGELVDCAEQIKDENSMEFWGKMYDSWLRSAGKKHSPQTLQEWRSFTVETGVGPW